MKSYEMHVWRRNEKTNRNEFQALKHPGRKGETYRYPNKKCAERMLKALYPAMFQGTELRVVEVDEVPNMRDPYKCNSYRKGD